MLGSHYPPPVYLGVSNASGTMLGGHGTLRRPREYEHTPPRIMSKIDIDQQYYYGWHPPINQTKKDPSSQCVDEQTVTLCPSGRTYCF